MKNLSKRLRIVMLDDVPDVLETAKVMIELSYDGAEILTFTKAEDALREIEREDPDLFTTDYTHDGISCTEMLRILASRKVKYPIFVISGHAETIKSRGLLDDAVQGLNVTFLSKPFTIGQLNAELCKHFGPGKKP